MGRTLRFSGKSDTILVRLLDELGLPPLPRVPQMISWAAGDCALVPYDAQGRQLPHDESGKQRRMWLDLRPRAKVRLTSEHNCQGAKQPTSIHIGSRKGQKFLGKPIPNAGAFPGNGTVMGRDEPSASIKLSIEGTMMRLGIWWLEAAVRGGPVALPVVNQKPCFEGDAQPPQPKPADGAAPARRHAEHARKAAPAPAGKRTKPKQ